MNAIILAAGKGNRLHQLTKDIPKPLISINGTPIIEQQISFLKEKGISEIFVVVGYKSEYFEYLTRKHDVQLIHNPYYEKYNNIFSLFLCKEILNDSYIIEGDSFPTRNFFLESPTESTYFTGKKHGILNEWILEFENKILQKIIICDNRNFSSNDSLDGFIMSGFSFWNKSDSAIIKKLLEKVIRQNSTFVIQQYECQYWDYLIYENMESFFIKIHEVCSEDWYEIDTLLDLNKAIQSYVNYNLTPKGCF
ncbi:NTP transferase domain-containing protein [Chitinophaga sp. OAE865]|uniref:sugar phosphate nucleotidyltransferase n=1 Tax=Chitinophaga sp. OAE865 TaxID=2817898 RepID=UPI001AE227BF